MRLNLDNYLSFVVICITLFCINLISSKPEQTDKIVVPAELLNDAAFVDPLAIKQVAMLDHLIKKINSKDEKLREFYDRSLKRAQINYEKFGLFV